MHPGDQACRPSALTDRRRRRRPLLQSLLHASTPPAGRLRPSDGASKRKVVDLSTDEKKKLMVQYQSVNVEAMKMEEPTHLGVTNMSTELFVNQHVGGSGWVVGQREMLSLLRCLFFT